MKIAKFLPTSRQLTIFRHFAKGILSIVSIDERVFFGEHALVQDARNQNAAAMPAIKYDVHPVLEAMQTGANIFAQPAEGRIVCERLATNLQFAQVSSGLRFAPGAKTVIADAEQV